ncbi:SusD/RagB family nutrient-binding outer membrane lipoprotein [Membranicola marinus]|uniref:SusD/RagB family nutrient-binding outer membrane lipoprotein n=1 Tax=Membranihabitans marinus TaxID=1227546 RepID=A0A953HWV5_9BACT|nr:SusD/RagB family nutrient-binding outer membrane lipoprotein [Membranihabitans marinus]MBY5958066.1 SusD/RagB family nutrient-binding outer membrane lipoprotein [Membranihabitans marinus]
MKNLYILLIVFTTSVVFTACDDYLDINENPNVATEAPLDGLVMRTTYQTPYNNYRVATSYTNYFVQYFASPNESSPTDTYEEVDYSSRWANLYGTMTDAYDLIRFSQEINASNHEAIGKLMMAVNLAMAADSWGSIPYSAGFSGEIIQPSYDSEEQVYNTLLGLIDEAISLINSGGDAGSPASDKDLIYSGNMDQWLNLAHGLKARYLNHFTKKSSYDPNAVLSAVSNGLEGNSDDAQLTFFDVRNPWAQAAINNDNLVLDGWMSEQIVDAMNGTTFGVVDPRLALITEPFEEDGQMIFRGTPNGAGRRGDGTIQEEVYLETSGFYSSEDAPLILFSYAEQKFIEAEAAFRSDDMDRALGAFRAAIRANMEKVGVDENAITAYFQDKYPDLDGSSLTLQNIMDEKYIALFLQPETWNDARRFDYQYTDFDLPANANLNDYIRRLEYPDTEKSRNGSNVPSIGGLTDPVFWDGK